MPDHDPRQVVWVEDALEVADHALTHVEEDRGAAPFDGELMRLAEILGRLPGVSEGDDPCSPG